jgi:hypothetical protein
MAKALPFTVASIARAIKGVESAGRFVVGVKPDGTLIIGDKPIETASFVPLEPQPFSPAAKSFGDYFNSGRRFGDKLGRQSNDPTSKWEDKRADEHTTPPAGVAAPSSERAPPRAYDVLLSRRRGGGWGSVVTIDDPELIERYRAAGFTLYEDGELEELTRKSPMGKRETAALGGFFRARGEPVDVKGARGQITSRLVTRGYIEIAEGKHRITPAGEAEWVRLTDSTVTAGAPSEWEDK